CAHHRLSTRCGRAGRSWNNGPTSRRPGPTQTDKNRLREPVSDRKTREYQGQPALRASPEYGYSLARPAQQIVQESWVYLSGSPARVRRITLFLSGNSSAPDAA